MPSISRDDRPVLSSLPLPAPVLVGVVAALLAVALIAVFTYRALATREVAVDGLTNTLRTIQQLDGLLSKLSDAETGQRGFLLTGEERYLEPYNAARAALPGDLRALREVMTSAPQRQQIDTLDGLIADDLDQMEQTIARRRTGDTAGALAIIRTDRGKVLMDRMRVTIADLSESERTSLAGQQADWQHALALSDIATWGGASLLSVLILGAAWTMSRDFRMRQAHEWVRAGQTGLSVRVQGEQRLDVLGQNVLSFLSEYVDAQVGSVYLIEPDDRLRRVAGYALPSGTHPFRAGDGLLGQAVRDGRALHVKDVPPGYLPISSSLGRTAPAELLVAPAIVDGHPHAVIELGFLRRLRAFERELLDRVSEAVAVAVRASRDRTRLEALLEETQRQAEELQTQQEELRVSNEELEEQSRALKESQGRLESQQAELEQINAQLEEQAQLLETQKDDLSAAQTTLLDKAAELARANQYKSEFLANMSHELRTPLNASLILAKLLADNKDGNLTADQTKFARTIFSAGNDLLALINDILDLSKIESGKVDLAAEPTAIGPMLASLTNTFEPAARQKGLIFTTTIEPGVPESIETDAQRLSQILRNLVSNACKFTEQGGVSVRVFPGGPGAIAFAVRDTGVGIPAHQHDVVFEAFRQADGSTHRKYGGTGLGLSISRDLARLLGGDITLESAPDAGSTFTLTLPVDAARRPAPVPASTPLPRAAAVPPFPAALPPGAPPRTEMPPPPGDPQPTAPPRPADALDDDRDCLSPHARCILVIEDDPRFAAILRDLAREMRFQCILASSAGEGLAAAVQFQPSAILLDIYLPDHSGLGVLDQLKRNPRTRHIPVHVVSVVDYTQQALERGAVGYDLKPVRREQIVDILRRLEARLERRVRHVLVVEDDERQRDSIEQLLKSEEVRITGVATAAEALEHLRTTTFDCMVMDLALPDLSGYELLEQLASRPDVSFPPVIVYTGRSLASDEEQRLSRFSKSIIIKDARSPERLLDEVTLFLHQVEATLPADRQRMLKVARDREAALENRRVLLVEDDARNIFAVSSILEPKGVAIEIARNGREALEALDRHRAAGAPRIDLVLMDIMMPEMDGLTAMREIRRRPEWKALPIIALTAKAMKDDQEKCLAAGANDYMAKPLEVEKLLSLVRVWMPK
jgi:CheY-like chemotaxis protein/CHASE3 domain sensor protein